MRILNLAALTNKESTVNRILEVSKEFDFTYHIYSSLDEVNEEISAQFFVIDLITEEEQSGIVQTVKYFNPEAFILTVLQKSVNEEDASFLKKSGASILLKTEDLYESSKLEFLAIQIIKCSYVVIKPSDLVVGSVIDFDIYHIMPTNQRYLRVISANTTLALPKKENILKYTSELYVKREVSQDYSQYMNTYMDKSMEGINSKCRAFFVTLQSYFLDLVIMLTDASPNVSFSQGKELLEKCQGMCSQLLTCLSESESPWNVVNSSVEGDFGSLERTPGQVATIGIMALRSKFDNVDDIMLATIMNNLGLLSLPYWICKKIKLDDVDSLEVESKEIYMNHPRMGINLVLSKKLPLEEKIKKIILNTHEKISNKDADLIPEESQLIQFNEKLDQICLTRLGQSKKHFKDELEKLILKEEDGSIYSPFLLQKIKG
jgi:response regulator RpfG family c-di-GMP phosphodiesterase